MTKVEIKCMENGPNLIRVDRNVFFFFNYLELVYPQQQQKKDLWDSVDIQNVN